MIDPDLLKLLNAWLSADSDEDVQHLPIDRLRTDRKFREAFVAELVMLGQLRAVQTSEPRWLQLEDEIGGQRFEELSQQEFERKVMQSIDAQASQPAILSKFINSPAMAWTATALLLSVILIVWSINHRAALTIPGNSSQDPAAQSDSLTAPVLPTLAVSRVSGVAVLSQAIDVDWNMDEPHEVGQTLLAGNLRFLTGTVQMEFLSGVRLLLRGPANVHLKETDEIVLMEGEASCFVSEFGRGFRIRTRDMEVIDLGTAFSINAIQGKQSEVHVLQGMVEIKTQQGAALELKENQAIRMAPEGPQSVAFDPSRFPQLNDINDAQQDRAQERFAAWQAYAARMRNEKDLVLHYTFEEPGTSPLELQNHAHNASRATHGAIVGCNWTSGRWPAKKALLYRHEGDRVLFQVPGSFPKLTFATWMRIDALTQTQTSVLMTEEPNRRQNLSSVPQLAMREVLARRSESEVKSVRWELFAPTPRMSFSVAYAPGKEDWKYESCNATGSFMEQSNWGRWSFVAVTIDTQSGQIIQYHDGLEIGRRQWKHRDPLLLDYMTLGNFSVSEKELLQSEGLAQRRFYGAIDELLIAQRVFTPEEIREVWNLGKP